MACENRSLSRVWMCRPAALAVALTCVLAVIADAQARRPSARRGAPLGPLTEMAISVGGTQYDARVDASCRLDEQATPASTRAYFAILYPWYGQRPPADQPQWRVTLEIRRSESPERYDQFALSFMDGNRSANIQTVAGSPRMGSGSVRVTRQGLGARFEVEGRSSQGEAIRATITCPRFRTTEAGG
jgi:hypothetical protein